MRTKRLTSEAQVKSPSRFILGILTKPAAIAVTVVAAGIIASGEGAARTMAGTLSLARKGLLKCAQVTAHSMGYSPKQ